MTDAQTEARAMPERIWITMEDHAASWAGSFRRWHASDLDHGDEYPQYVRADIHAAAALAAKDAELAEVRAERAEAQLVEKDAEISKLRDEITVLREALGRLINPTPGVKKLPPWVYGIVGSALRTRAVPVGASE